MTNNKDSVFQDKTKLNKSASSVSTTLLGKIQQMKENSKHNLLIDVSGSMGEYVYEEGESRNTATTKKSILESLLTKLPAGITKFAFSDHIVEFSDGLPFEGQGTRMGMAFEHMKLIGRKEIVLITDGMPDSAAEALQASKGLKIDIIYIGPQPRPQFLEELARKTSGSFTNINLIQRGATKELENKVQLLLGS